VDPGIFRIHPIPSPSAARDARGATPTPYSSAASDHDLAPMFEQTFRNIDDILHKDAGCTSELDYTEQSSWLLFLK
jgi:hypothetical protein